MKQTHNSMFYSMSMFISPGVRFLPPGLLQLAVLRHLWRTDEPAAVGSERRRPSGYWHLTLRPHIAGAPSATLATGMPARRLQGGHTRTPVAVWHFTTVPGRRLPSCHRCSWAATAFHSELNMCSDADIQHLWRQSVRTCRPRTMEQSSVVPERRWHIVLWIPAVAKDISVWIVGPRRSVNCINCAD